MPTLVPMSQPMTASEVAATLGASLTTVKRKAKAGKLPTIGKLHGATGAYLFDREAIEAMASEVAA